MIHRFLIFILILTLGLEVFLRISGTPAYLIPRPAAVLEALFTDRQILLDQFLITLQEWLIGLSLSIVIGIFLALLCFFSPFARSILNPFLVASQSVPYLAFAPLLLLWFGLGMLPKIILVMLTCIFPIALNFEADLQRGREEYSLVTAMLKLPMVKALLHVYIPYALPGFFSGLKISASYAFVGAVLAELIGSESGLGVYIARSQSTYRPDRMVAAILLVVLFSVSGAILVDALRNRIIFWNRAKK
jgi:putative hydroxymethylpyrimidine transport system permease protein